MQFAPLKCGLRRAFLLTAPVALLFLGFLGACGSLPQESRSWNVVGFPAKGLSFVGFQAADSGLPILREVGRLLQATGELADAPALCLEGILGADGGRLVAAGEHLVVGSGSSLTAAWNVPFFWVPGRNIDLASDVGLVNQALAYVETLPAEVWHTAEDDDRTTLFPIGTRARASRRNLIFEVPGRGEVLQVADGNSLWSGLQTLTGTNFPAQERSWGFIVRDRSRWNSLWERQRAKTILHEFYHQEMQMRRQFLGWTTLYWPAYMATFPFIGWDGHWAEMNGPNAAGAVDRALANWQAEDLSEG